MSDASNGYVDLEKARSRDARFASVVLCERRDLVHGRYSVWYEDKSGRRSIGYFTSNRDDARAEFQRRSAARA